MKPLSILVRKYIDLSGHKGNYADEFRTGIGEDQFSITYQECYRMQLTRKEDISPICPHCQTTLDNLCFQELRGVLGRRYVYFCSSCNKILGVSHRKGFWMG
jgi:hypothetical protein